jgi:hypothetical protein
MFTGGHSSHSKGGPRRVRARRSGARRRGPHASGRSGTTGWVAAWLASTVVAVFMQLGPRWRGRASHDDPGPWAVGAFVDAADAHDDQATASARLARAPDPSGGEVLRGETTFRWTSDALARVTEEVRLDAAGRLVRADVEVRTTGDGAIRESRERLSIDASQGLVESITGEGVTERHPMPTDLPWAYVPVEAPGGKATSTPPAAIVAERAARGHEAVWLVDARGHGAAVMSDQILVPADAESRAGSDHRTVRDSWLVLGDDLATFGTDGAGRRELLGLRVAALGAELTPRVTRRGSP